MHPCVYCSIIYNSQDMKATQGPINRQVGKKSVAHTYNGILLGHIMMKSYHLQQQGWAYRISK